MTMALYPFMVLALCGLILSVGVHVASLLGFHLPGGKLVWSLHIGIFVVWLPTVLVSMRIGRGTNRKDAWNLALSGCPVWMRRALYLVMGYAVFNFLIFMLAGADHPKPPGDAPPEVIRGFSGHWMVFYGAAFETLYSVIHRPALLEERKCERGHAISLTDSFCPRCGLPLAGPGRE
jgi:hypothetical protein